MRATLLLGGLIIAIGTGAAGYWFGSKPVGERRLVSSEHGNTKTFDSIPTESNDALRNQLAQLELKVDALTAHVAGQGPNNNTPEAASASPTNAPVSVAAQAEHDSAEWENHMAAVDADFQAEPRDARWAHSSTELLRDLTTNDKVMRTAVKQIECRSTICRVDMIDDRKGDFARKLPEFLQGVAKEFPTGQARTVDNPDGTKTLSFYLSTTSGLDAPGSTGS